MEKCYTTCSWPVLKTYTGDYLRKIAMPIGGIGTGTISLGGRGDLRDWELCNAPAKGFIPYSGVGAAGRVGPFFAFRTSDQHHEIHAGLMEGPIDENDYEGQQGSESPNHGFPRFDKAEFHAAFPFGQVHLSDPDLPITVNLKAFNPLVPGDADASGLPVAVISFEVENLTDGELDLSVCGTIPNFIGDDHAFKSIPINHDKASKPIPHDEGGFVGAKGNLNTFREVGSLKGIFMTAPELPEACRHRGDISLTTLSDGQVSFRTGWSDQVGWGNSKLDFWNDFTTDGTLEDRPSTVDKPLASLCLKTTLAPAAKTTLTFMITWRFPNRRAWSPGAYANGMKTCQERENIGNYYATLYEDSFTAALKIAAKLTELEEKTRQFVSSFIGSDLPDVVKEAALFNVSTLKTETCFRTTDGRFYAWEGCGDSGGTCYGSCTHVWNYEHTMPFLFGSLARDMREIEFMHTTDDAGHMSFRVELPLEVSAMAHKLAAADGQMGCIMKVYRDWQLCGDDAFLRKLWPRVRKAMEFCWIEGGWDADRDGVMEGCQHNTMDVEYYGPNPQMGFWYLGALRCAALMADYMDEADFAADCRQLAENGARLLEEKCFNGEYFEHIIQAPGKDAKIAAGLTIGAGTKDLDNPDLQLGSGCLVDQLVGQYTAHVLGLGALSDPAKQRATLEAIYKYNFKPSMRGHFNRFRSYALGREAATLMATYPKGRRPDIPFPYADEVMTGFEYAAAIHMLYEGMTEKGLELIEAIRERYDGRKRSPFDEAECGHHYGRAMAAWAAVLALTGFHYSGVERKMRFKATNGRFFWSNGDAWGECMIQDDRVTLSVLHGTLSLKTLCLDNGCTWTGNITLDAGESRELQTSILDTEHGVRVTFAQINVRRTVEVNHVRVR